MIRATAPILPGYFDSTRIIINSEIFVHHRKDES